jgi:hypothetical protein
MMTRPGLGSYEHEYSDGCIGFFSHGEPPAVELCVQDFLSELGRLLERQLEVLSETLLQ